jgi:hypothetical protein
MVNTIMITEDLESCRIEWYKVIHEQKIIPDLKDFFLIRYFAHMQKNSSDENLKKLARLFIIKTTFNAISFENPDVLEFSEVENKIMPSVITYRADADVNAVLFQHDIGKTIKEIHFYIKAEGENFKFSHKYNLTELSKKWSMPNKNLHIRQIGDPTLHRQRRLIDFNDPNYSMEIQAQLLILRKVLTLTGGVGIAIEILSMFQRRSPVTQQLCFHKLKNI